MAAVDMTLDSVVSEVAKRLGVNERLDKIGADVAALSAINDRMTTLETGTVAKTDLDAAVEEIREVAAKIQRLERAGIVAPHEEGAPYRIDMHGRVVPQLSKGLLEFVRDAIAINAPGYREFAKRTLGRDVHDLTFFNRDTSQLNSGAGTVGGYLVPPEYVPELQKLLTIYGQARKMFRVIPMQTEKLTMPALDGEMTVYEIDENIAPTQSFPTTALFTLNATIWGALTHIPLKLIMQANPAIVQIVVEAIFRAFAKNEDVQGFTRSTGIYRGLLYTPTTGNTNSRGNANKVSLAATKTHISDVTFADFQAMINATPTPALEGASFLMHRTILAHLQSLAQAQPASWYNPLIQRPDGSFTLYGYPVVLVEALPVKSTAVTADKPFASFCNTQYMALGDMEQPSIAQDSSIGFKEGQIWVRGLEIFGFEATVKDAITVLYTAAA